MFIAIFGDNLHNSNELFCFRLQCTIHEGETQLSASNNNSAGRGLINEEGQRNTNEECTKDIVEDDGVNASLRRHESPDHCSLRQNLQNKTIWNERLEKKGHKVISQKGKLLAEICQGHEERLQILKRMAEKTEASDSHNPVFTFFRGMAQTEPQFSPNIIAKTRVKVCKLVGEMEGKALCEQNRPTTLGCPFHDFSSSFHCQVLCYSGHGHVPPASCQSSTQMLSSLSPTTDSCSHVTFRTNANTTSKWKWRGKQRRWWIWRRRLQLCCSSLAEDRSQS